MCDHCVTGDLPALAAVIFFIIASAAIVGWMFWDDGWRPWRR